MGRSFLNIPFDEHIVPFPNFGSVLMQHAREFPDKTAIHTAEHDMTYLQLLQYCMTCELKNGQHDLLSLLAGLYKGIQLELSFDHPLNINTDILPDISADIDFFDPPYVRLDDKALTLNAKYEFTQYNILVAAQAVGKAFRLFRDGAALCSPLISNVADLTFGILGPLYFGKSIYFTDVDQANFFQYAWNSDIDSDLRDAVMVKRNNTPGDSFVLHESYDQALGLGNVIDLQGISVVFLGFEIINGEPEGHCLGIDIT